MFALLRAAPAIRRGLYARPRLFSSSLAHFVRSGNAVKAPRWVNSRQPQDTPPAQEEDDDSTKPDESNENSDSLSSSEIQLALYWRCWNLNRIAVSSFTSMFIYISMSSISRLLTVSSPPKHGRSRSRILFICAGKSSSHHSQTERLPWYT